MPTPKLRFGNMMIAAIAHIMTSVNLSAFSFPPRHPLQQKSLEWKE
jgi:hypothetical protein